MIQKYEGEIKSFHGITEMVIAAESDALGNVAQ
jgi:hypothetical protein